MPSVLLLHTNQEYAETLAAAVEDVAPDFDVDVVSREPLTTRIAHLLDRRYDLIQTDELLVNGVLAATTSMFTRTPFVSAVRGWADYTNAHGEYSPVRFASIRLRTQAVLRRSSGIIYLSERTREEFESHYSVAEGTVVGRPIDIEHYQSGAREASNHDELRLLTTTNLRYKQKYEGVRTILEGLAPLFETNDDLRYAVAGDGQYLTELREFLEEYPYANRVTLLGYREDIPAVLADADVFVYLSFLDAYPTVVLEAQAAGLPVIGGDAVGVPAVVGEAGIVCEPTADGVRTALERVSTDESYRNQLAKQSREKMERYNQDCASGHLDVWKRILDYSL